MGFLSVLSRNPRLAHVPLQVMTLLFGGSITIALLLVRLHTNVISGISQLAVFPSVAVQKFSSLVRRVGIENFWTKATLELSIC